MARFSRIEVVTTMSQTGFVPLFYHADVALSIDLIKACHRGGAKVIEFTNRGDFAHEVFGEINKYCAKNLPDIILGAGSVIDAGTTSLFIQLGANFIVSPSLREDVGLVCNRRKILWSPGCGSLSEIGRAEEMGVEIVKLFPGSVYGAEFVRTIKGPSPWTSIMPTGGVTMEEENLKKWFSAGVTCVGMGSDLISKTVISNRDFDLLEKNTRMVGDTIKKIRQSLQK